RIKRGTGIITDIPRMGRIRSLEVKLPELAGLNDVVGNCNVGERTATVAVVGIDREAAALQEVVVDRDVADRTEVVGEIDRARLTEIAHVDGIVANNDVILVAPTAELDPVVVR